MREFLFGGGEVWSASGGCDFGVLFCVSFFPGLGALGGWCGFWLFDGFSEDGVPFGVGDLVGSVGWRCGLLWYWFRLGDVASSDGGYEFAEGIGGGLFGCWLGFVVGAEHAIGFPDGVDDVAVARVGAVDDLFESVEKFLAGEAWGWGRVLHIVILTKPELNVEAEGENGAVGTAHGCCWGGREPWL
ncbi:MAG: hypothetical protein CMO55_18690 [Verrucomicrobiales bacterium]|nr:hypothetical protein [Verrucomicrobiales bacterium]